MSIGDERGRTAERARRGRGPLPDLGAASSLLLRILRILRILRMLRILLLHSRPRPPCATQRWKPSATGVPSQYWLKPKSRAEHPTYGSHLRPLRARKKRSHR